MVREYSNTVFFCLEIQYSVFWGFHLDELVSVASFCGWKGALPKEPFRIHGSFHLVALTSCKAGMKKLWTLRQFHFFFFGNIVLLEHGHAHFFIYIIHGCFCPKMTALSSCDRDYLTRSLKYLLSSFFFKSLLASGVDPCSPLQGSLWDSVETFMVTT